MTFWNIDFCAVLAIFGSTVIKYMPQSYHISIGNNSTTITIAPLMKPVVLMGLLTVGLFFFSLGGLYVYSIIMSWYSAASAVLPGLFAVAFILIGAAFLRRVTERETIVATPDSITIINGHIFGKRIGQYPVNEIENIAYAGPEDFTPHPFEGKYFDIGFGAGEKQVQYLISEGNLILVHQGIVRRFGRNVPSWDGEDIIRHIELATDKQFLQDSVYRNHDGEDEDEYNDGTSSHT